MNVFSTDEVPASQRFAFWRDVSAKLWVPYDLHCEPQLRSGFQAQVKLREFGPVQATLMTTTPHSVHRAPRLIRQSDPEVFKLGCLAHGRHMITQDGRRTDFAAGDLALYDTSRPYEAGIAPDIPLGRLMILRFPRSLLPFPDRDLRRLTAVRIPGDRGIGALTAQFLLQLARHMNELSQSEAARLSSLTLDMLTMTLAATLDTESAVPPHTRQGALMAQINTFIRNNLGNSNLTPDTIAAAHHISLRYLYRLFERQGHTVAGWIRTQRLERCRADLADPAQGDTAIQTIATRWGFTHAADFSRAFRTAYGLPPRDYRRTTLNALVCKPG